ncbi:N-acetylmuramoyl-L-alanine amidase family protein [Aureispira anguillae]|uniref:N-acetylmuramoyl-L-alanine amidase n=1 Tax=Aureispira anguillae TaxID=2864201 RepID=A0A915YJI9_9BACT|nr:N-acetylmuramoyl-L-alanine amidase [Aureispira anguillae]BDS14116.1 N-acetylmuramoyl-L-alanine amidase [Aureispira anguillae]
MLNTNLYQFVLFLVITAFLYSPETKGQSKKEYIRAVAQKGDGIYLLLGRYHLDRNACSLEQFCKLNKLKKNASLKLGKSYKLPIVKYRYNQKSIRSTANIKDWQSAKRVERYNDLMVELGYKASDFRRGTRELWVPYHMKYCPLDVSKFVPKNRNFPIFGEKYAKVPLKDDKLAGAVYYIVAGHGGPDPGAMAKYKGKYLCEDEYAYDISLRLARNLVEHGAVVYFIVRDKNDGIRNAEYLKSDMDERCWPNAVIPVGQKARLTQRSDIINELYEQNRRRGVDYQRLIEIHVDSRMKSKRIDLFFYYYPTSQGGKALAAKLHHTMKKKYAANRKSGEYHGSVIPRDLHMLREVKPLPVFIEVGNIQNPNDQKRILYASNRQALADWLEEGLLKDY